MEEVKTNAGQGLGIAGLIMGILAVLLAIIPCTTPVGLVLGITGLILSAIGLSQATKLNGLKGMPTAGLVVSILGTCIAIMWVLFFAKGAGEFGKWWSREGPGIMKEIHKDLGDEFEDTFEDIGDELENAGKKLEDKLENLEYEMDWEEKWGQEITQDEFEDVLDTYESLIKDYSHLVDAAEKGDVGALSEYVKVSAKAVALASKITAISPRLSEEQRQKFEELQQKYEKIFEETEEK